MLKLIIKKIILKSSKGKKNVVYQGIITNIIIYFPSETREARKQWYNILKMLKEQ